MGKEPQEQNVPLRTVIVAEIGANHGQQYNRAKALVQAAALAGADAVKVQMFIPDQMTLNRFSPDFRIADGLWAGQTLYEVYEKAYMPISWVPSLQKLAALAGLGFIASVYHPDMVPVAVEYGVETLKIASFEAGWTDLLHVVAATEANVIVSTGTSDLPEIEKVVEIFGTERLALLRCVSQYPAPLERANLLTIPDMIMRFDVPVGLSDHSLGCVCAVVAVSMGASIIEKHLKIDNEGLDAAFSADPAEFRTMVETVRAAEKARGQVDYAPSTTRFKRKEYQGQWVRTVR